MMNLLVAGLSAWTVGYMRDNRDDYDPVIYKLLYVANWICGLFNTLCVVSNFYAN